MALFCTKCGKQQHDGEAFCTNCGQPYPHVQSETVISEQSPTTKVINEKTASQEEASTVSVTNEKKPNYLGWVLGIVGFLGVLLIYSLLQGKTESQIEGLWHETSTRTENFGSVNVALNIESYTEYDKENKTFEEEGVVNVTYLLNGLEASYAVEYGTNGTWEVGLDKQGKKYVVSSLTKNYGELSMGEAVSELPAGTTFSKSDFEDMMQELIFSEGSFGCTKYKVQNFTGTSMKLVDEDGIVSECKKE